MTGNDRRKEDEEARTETVPMISSHVGRLEVTEMKICRCVSGW